MSTANKPSNTTSSATIQVELELSLTLASNATKYPSLSPTIFVEDNDKGKENDGVHLNSTNSGNNEPQITSRSSDGNPVVNSSSSSIRSYPITNSTSFVPNLESHSSSNSTSHHTKPLYKERVNEKMFEVRRVLGVIMIIFLCFFVRCLIRDGEIRSKQKKVEKKRLKLESKKRQKKSKKKNLEDLDEEESTMEASYLDDEETVMGDSFDNEQNLEVDVELVGF